MKNLFNLSMLVLLASSASFAQDISCIVQMADPDDKSEILSFIPLKLEIQVDESKQEILRWNQKFKEVVEGTQGRVVHSTDERLKADIKKMYKTFEKYEDTFLGLPKAKDSLFAKPEKIGKISHYILRYEAHSASQIEESDRDREKMSVISVYSPEGKLLESWLNTGWGGEKTFEGNVILPCE